jgi:hypothetical protein
MHRPTHRLRRWQRRSLYTTGWLLMATGVAWLLVHYGLGAGAGNLPHPAEAWLLRAHGLAAFGGLFMFGVVAAWHVPHGWQLARRHGWDGQRSTGTLLCALAALLALSGYALFYFAPENLRPPLGWAHTITGLVLAALLASHRRGL